MGVRGKPKGFLPAILRLVEHTRPGGLVAVASETLLLKEAVLQVDEQAVSGGSDVFAEHNQAGLVWLHRGSTS